jgi:hypothetical protein
MKTYIETHPVLRKPNLETPIELDGVEVFKNKKDQWVLSFSSRNHKYLNINYNISSSHINGERCKFGVAYGFEIETEDVWLDGNLIDQSEDKITLWLIPESKEESDGLCGIAAVFLQKWSHAACIVPYDDFYLPETA